MATIPAPSQRKAATPKRAAAAKSDSLTPAMRQYVDQKKRIGDAVLLFRMGDFYETFYEDAVLCAKVLGIALTSRNKGSVNEIPLAGIPYHALEGYLKKLVVAGYRVAISEQLENPKEAKGVVKRDIVRIVTAGTLTDEALLSEGDDNTLAAVCLRGGEAGLAMIELASGRFELIDVTNDTLVDALVCHAPDELLIDDERDEATERLARQVEQLCGTVITRRPAHELAAYQAEKSLLAHFGSATLAGFGLEAVDASVCAAGGIIQYLGETQKTALGHITSLRRRVTGDYVQLDHSTYRSLEIERTLRSASREGTLHHAIDRTVHPIGKRKLRHWLRAPLTDVEAIIARQDAVGLLQGDEPTRSRVRRALSQMADVERIASRVALARTHPRDLAALGQTLSALPDVAQVLTETRLKFLSTVADDLLGLSELATLLRRTLRDDPPPTQRDGGFIADGFDAELDRLRSIGHDGRTWLAEYQRKEAERTGIANLKVGFNKVFGYYIEISHASRGEVPPEYVRKQTIKNAERYITDELKKYEHEVLTAHERAVELEGKLFAGLCTTVAGEMAALLRVAGAIGRLDCVAGLAEVAVERRYVRPEFTTDGVLDIRDGRHPVLDQTLGDGFVPNDCVMSRSDGHTFVITGPNMAGKSTYIRQVALLTLLAQTGSFVPASAMTLAPVDRVFARVGSADEIMRGQSTFMVEMTEAANILHNATAQSLVVLDELGRGTSTFDGLSLAWAITEHLAAETRCRSLIATHYHEMTELSQIIRGVRNYNVAVREYTNADPGSESIVFLHKIVEGGANQSYGIHVARLAGIPRGVTDRAREVMEELQRGFERESKTPQLSRKKTKRCGQLSLFGEPGREPEKTKDAPAGTGPNDSARNHGGMGEKDRKLLDALRETDVNRLTPLDALQRIAEWKRQLD